MVKSAVEATMKPAAMKTAAMKPATAAHAAVTAHALGHCGCGRNREDCGQKKRPSQTHLDLLPRVPQGLSGTAGRIIPNNPSGFIRFCRFPFVATAELPSHSGPFPSYDRDPRQLFHRPLLGIG
jgi:hypothetical protein